MNILINSYCNLNCQYCFADEFLSKSGIKDMNLEDFKYCLDFLKNSNIKTVKLLGGEPTLSKFFTRYCDEVISYEYFERIIIFSNGIIQNDNLEYIKLKSKLIPFVFLINLNSPDIIHEKFYQIQENVKELIAHGIEVVVGVNIFDGLDDYNFAIDFAINNGINKMRWSLATPLKKDKLDLAKYYTVGAKKVIGFLEECKKNNIQTASDCNYIPICFLKDDELRKLVMFEPRFLLNKCCEPVIDVLPNLKVIRCFSAFNKLLLDLRNFSDVSELRREFLNSIDKNIKYKNFDGCESCEINRECSRGCIGVHL